jgi:predicted transcriptional regulator of viral defense system
MKLIDVHAQLLKMERPVFQTSDAAAWLKINNAHMSKLLARLAESGHLVHLGRGLWAFRDRVEPLALPEYLTNPFPSYVSLQSALYYHGMISQIPDITYAVSIARTKRYETSLGMVSIHHVHPSFFFGFENVGRSIAKMATPEKALIDFFYLSPAKSKLFRALPEVELPRSFRLRTVHNTISRIISRRRRVLVKNLFEDFISKSGR